MQDSQDVAVQEQIRQAEQCISLEHQLVHEATKLAELVHAAANEAETQLQQARTLCSVAERTAQENEERLETAKATLNGILETEGEERRVLSTIAPDRATLLERVALEEELDVLEHSLMQHETLQQARTDARERQRQAVRAHAAAVAELHVAEEAHAAAMRELQRAATRPEERHLNLDTEIAAVKQALTYAEDRAAEATERVCAAQQAVDSLPPLDGAIQEDGKGAHHARLIFDCTNIQEEIEGLEKRITALRHGCVMAAHTSSEAARALGTKCTLPSGMVPLHSCFTFKSAGDCTQYSTALEVLAGRKLRVIVARTAKAAAALAGRGGAAGQRLWALDILPGANRALEQRQRKAQEAFSAGE